MKDQNTNNYYDKNSHRFIEGTVGADMSEHYEKFLSYIPEGGTIIDAGCGSGRDVKNFRDLGYNVIAFDYSIKMVELASAYAGIDVMHCDFLDFKIQEKVHGIWACASLLHVDEKKQREVLEKYRGYLLEDGVFFMSFKYGEESYEKSGRYFYCHTLESLKNMILEIGGYEIRNLYTTEDVREDRKNEMWCSAIIGLKSEDVNKNQERFSKI